MYFKVKQTLIEQGYNKTVEVTVSVKRVTVNYDEQDSQFYSCYDYPVVLARLSMILEDGEVDKVYDFIFNTCIYLSEEEEQVEVKKEVKEVKKNDNEQLSLF